MRMAHRAAYSDLERLYPVRLPSRRWLLKRTVDLTLLLPLAVVAVILVPILALAVYAVSRGNPFYAQVREGLGGRAIKVWKLRTMHLGSEALLERHLAEHPDDREEWERSFKLTRDPRIIPVVGRALRRSSLDELPQLWNIALGEMSFVGPRPFPEYHLQAFDEEFRSVRRTVVPGLTGLWQVSGRSDGDLERQRALDERYINEWSVWLELYVLLATPWAVFRGRGAR
jgi:lipopolysaccharide/colanic/teichoic acid biosynthesis glycosyltransferase